MDSAGIAFRLRAVPAAVFVDLLREDGGPLMAGAIKDRLEQLGVRRAAVNAAWRSAQPAVRRHGNVVFDPARMTYQWGDTRAPVPAMSAQEALDRLLPPRLTARRTDRGSVLSGRAIPGDGAGKL